MSPASNMRKEQFGSNELTIGRSVIHYTVRPDASTSSAQGTQSVSKGKTCINLGLRYLSPNGAIIANYGMLDKFISTIRTKKSLMHNKGNAA